MLDTMPPTSLARLLPIIALVCPAASAQSFNVDFGSFALGYGLPSATFGAASGSAGVWNLVDADQLGGAVFTSGPLRTTSDTPTAVVVELDPLGGTFYPFEENAPLTSGDAERLLDDCYYALGDSALTLRGLTPGTYRLFTYALAPDDASFRTGVAVQSSPDPLQSVGGDFAAGFVLGVTHAEHRVTVAAGEAVVVRCSVLSGIDSVNGLQVVQTGQFLGSGYCTATPNSTGRPASIVAVGDAHVVANSVELRASDLPLQSTTFFLTSPVQASVPGAGGSQGTLCLGGAIGRFRGPGQVLNSGTAGAVALTLDLTRHPTPNGFVAVQAGETWNFQAWYRDSIGGASTSNFTSGLAVAFL